MVDDVITDRALLEYARLTGVGHALRDLVQHVVSTRTPRRTRIGLFVYRYRGEFDGRRLDIQLICDGAGICRSVVPGYRAGRLPR